MQTQVQNMNNYVGYMKCGEILSPPPGSYQHPYVLKCFQCKEIYLLYEAFIFHIEDHCKALIAEGNNETVTEIHSNEEQMGLSSHINIDIKVEENQSVLTADPLNDIKPEPLCEYDEPSSLKEELNPPDGHDNEKELDKGDEENLTNAEEFCETDDSLENLDNNALEGSQSGDEEIVNSSDIGSSDEDSVYEIRIVKQSEHDLGYISNQSDFIKEFLKTKEHVISLIEAYKNQPYLWNKNFPFLRHKIKRQNCLQDIADALNKEHELSVTWNQVAGLIVYICRKYREDLKCIKKVKEGEEEYAPSWFFENLNFLKPFVENNQMAKLDSHLPDLLPNQIMDILDIYKRLPHLWNTDMIEHYCKNKIYAAKQEMLQAVETKLGIKITESILEDYFRTIHNCFTRAKRKKLDERSGKNVVDTSTEDNMQENYYEYMIFLYDHVGSFKCTECKRSFKSPMYLKIHQSQAHGFDPLPCSLCKKQFKSVGAYTNHAKRHMKDLNHECKECGKKFLHSTELRIHMRNHTGVKPFCCEICGASFRYIQGFSNHHRRHIKNYLHTCEICGKGFYSKDRYNDHMNSHSNTRNQVCNVCGKTFITKRSLQQHVVIHDDVRRHACKLCGKTFKHKTGVNQHMRTHAIASSEEKSATKKE